MAIPLYAAMANGGKLYTLDDTSVGADLYDASGPTYTAFTATLTVSPFTLGTATYASLRRYVQNVVTGAAATLTVTGIRDGVVSGASVTRALATTDPTDVVVPLKVMGSPFSVTVEASGWTAATSPALSLGAAAFTVVPRRGARGGSET